MNEHVKAVVDGFRRLASDEQARAYLEIDAIWTDLRDDEPASHPASFSVLEFASARKPN